MLSQHAGAHDPQIRSQLFYRNLMILYRVQHNDNNGISNDQRKIMQCPI